ncbi:hypothetical protein MRX96_032623 [Rhipicephalus microplus]
MLASIASVRAPRWRYDVRTAMLQQMSAPAARAPGLVCTDKRACQRCDASAAVPTTRINVLTTEHGSCPVPRASIDEAVRDRELIVLAHRLIRSNPRRAGALQPSPSSRPCTYTSVPSWRTRQLRHVLSRDRVAGGSLAPGLSRLRGLSPRNYACTAPRELDEGARHPQGPSRFSLIPFNDALRARECMRIRSIFLLLHASRTARSMYDGVTAHKRRVRLHPRTCVSAAYANVVGRSGIGSPRTDELSPYRRERSREPVPTTGSHLLGRASWL